MGFSKAIIMHDDSKIQLGIAISRHRENQGPVTLKTHHLIGVFIIWALGMTISITVFCIEQVVYKLKSRMQIDV